MTSLRGAYKAHLREGQASIANRRRSKGVEQKSKRDDKVNKRRNLSEDMSPIIEKHDSVLNIARTKKGLQRKKADNVLERLQQWRTEKKRQQEQEKQTTKSKPMFKVQALARETEANLFKASSNKSKVAQIEKSKATERKVAHPKKQTGPATRDARLQRTAKSTADLASKQSTFVAGKQPAGPVTRGARLNRVAKSTADLASKPSSRAAKVSSPKKQISKAKGSVAPNTCAPKLQRTKTTSDLASKLTAAAAAKRNAITSPKKFLRATRATTLQKKEVENKKGGKTLKGSSKSMGNLLSKEKALSPEIESSSLIPDSDLMEPSPTKEIMSVIPNEVPKILDDFDFSAMASSSNESAGDSKAESSDNLHDFSFAGLKLKSKRKSTRKSSRLAALEDEGVESSDNNLISFTPEVSERKNGRKSLAQRRKSRKSVAISAQSASGDANLNVSKNMSTTNSEQIRHQRSAVIDESDEHTAVGRELESPPVKTHYSVLTSPITPADSDEAVASNYSTTSNPLTTPKSALHNRSSLAGRKSARKSLGQKLMSPSNISATSTPATTPKPALRSRRSVAERNSVSKPLGQRRMSRSRKSVTTPAISASDVDLNVSNNVPTPNSVKNIENIPRRKSSVISVSDEGTAVGRELEPALAYRVENVRRSARASRILNELVIEKVDGEKSFFEVSLDQSLKGTGSKNNSMNLPSSRGNTPLKVETHSNHASPLTTPKSSLRSRHSMAERKSVRRSLGQIHVTPLKSSATSTPVTTPKSVLHTSHSVSERKSARKSLGQRRMSRSRRSVATPMRSASGDVDLNVSNNVPTPNSVKNIENIPRRRSSVISVSDEGTAVGRELEPALAYRVENVRRSARASRILNELVIEKVDGEKSFFEVSIDESMKGSRSGSRNNSMNLPSSRGSTPLRVDKMFHSNNTSPFTPRKSNEVTASNSSSNSTPLTTPKSALRTRNSMAPSSGFKEPGLPASALRPAGSLRRRTYCTPKSKTPEQMISILKKSPMVEMSRRKSRHLSSPAPKGQYFRDLIINETERLTNLSNRWNLLAETEIGLSEEVLGQIRCTVGKAFLLMEQRFKQFSGLVDNYVYGLGEKETTPTDLQGFWDMIYFQVEDVNNQFKDLEELHQRGWQAKAATPKADKLNLKKKITKGKPKPKGVKSNFAAFRAELQKKKAAQSSSTLTMDQMFVV